MNILLGDKVFTPYLYKKEEEFEKRVAALADQLFGEQSIYLDVKKRLKSKSFLVVPDGFLVDMTLPASPKFYVVENEISTHDPIQHIGYQLLRFAINYEEARYQIKGIVMEEIQKNESMLARLEAGRRQSDARNIDNYLERAIYDNFKALVVIDEAAPTLYKVLEKINANISVIQIKTFQCENEYTYQYDTLYDDAETAVEDPAPRSPAEQDSRRKRRAKCDMIIVPAQEEGFQAEFIGRSQWFAIRIGAAMKDKIKYIAAYQSAPVSAVTYIAEVKSIRPYQDTGKYLVEFKGPAEKLNREIRAKDSKYAPQGPIYAQRERLDSAVYLEDLLNWQG